MTQAVPILVYHSVSHAPASGIAPFTVCPDQLARQLDVILAGSHTALTVSELVSLFDAGRPLPARTVVITFDAGFEDNLTVAAQLLQERQLPATVFVTTGYLLGGPQGVYPRPGPMLGWDGLAALEAAGIEVGSHGHSHRPLDVLSRDVVRAELRLSKALLEATLCHRIRTFAYPHGYASRWVEEEVERCGFQAACGVRNALSHPGDNRWRLARLTVGPGTTVEQVAGWLRGSHAPVASRRERLRTKAWREARRASALVGVHPVGAR